MTGLLYPSLVIAVSVVTDVVSLLSAGELEPGSSMWSGELSLGGLWSAVGATIFIGLLIGIPGAFFGAVVGLVAGLVCGAIDSATRRQLEPNQVGLLGVALYLLIVLLVGVDGRSDVGGVLMAMGPGLLAAAMLRIAPIRFARVSGWVVTSDATDQTNPTDLPDETELAGVKVRPARPDDVERLRAIERAAGERFREVDLAAIAEDEPMTVEQLAEYAVDGRSFVATFDVDGSGAAGSAPEGAGLEGRALVVGYVLVEQIDGAAHVEQISVDPAAQGRGVGRALLDRVERYAHDHSAATLTLTTFTDVPWNAPLYEHLGFRVLRDDELGPELVALIAEEAADGLDPDQRVAMARPVGERAARSSDRGRAVKE